MMLVFCKKSDEVEQLSSSKHHANTCGFCRRSPFQAHVRVHEIVNHQLQVQKIPSTLMTSEIPHRLRPVLNVSVIPLDCVIVVFKPVLPARDRHAKPQLANTVEQFVECVPVILEAVAHESYEFAFRDWLVPFSFVDFKHLGIARRFYLPQKIHAGRNSAFYDVGMRQNILCLAVNRVQVIAVTFAHMNEFLVNVYPSFDDRFQLLVQLT